MAGKVTREQQELVLLLHREGKGRNVIARESKVAAATVTKIVHAAGLDFDRTATAVATKARQLDCKDIRTQLERDLLEDAQRLRKQLWQATVYAELGRFSEGGEGGATTSEFVERIEPEPRPADKLKLMQSTAVAIQNSLKLTDANRDSGTDEAKSMLGQLHQQLLQTFLDAQAEEARG